MSLKVWTVDMSDVVVMHVFISASTSSIHCVDIGEAASTISSSACVNALSAQVSCVKSGYACGTLVNSGVTIPSGTTALSSVYCITLAICCCDIGEAFSEGLVLVRKPKSQAFAS